MKKKDLRDLLSRAATFADNPLVFTPWDRVQLAEELHAAAVEAEFLELIPIPKNNVERFRIMLKNEEEVALYTKMVELAGRDPEYDKRFQQYIREGSTLELRELARPFGQYWTDLAFFNIVTGIDSAHLHFTDVERLEDEPGWKWDDDQKTYVRI